MNCNKKSIPVLAPWHSVIFFFNVKYPSEKIKINKINKNKNNNNSNA